MNTTAVWMALLLIVLGAGLFAAFVAVGFPWLPLLMLWVFMALCVRSIWRQRKG